MSKSIIPSSILRETNRFHEVKVVIRISFSIRFNLRVDRRMTLDPRKAYLDIKRSRIYNRGIDSEIARI